MKKLFLTFLVFLAACAKPASKPTPVEEIPSLAEEIDRIVRAWQQAKQEAELAAEARKARIAEFRKELLDVGMKVVEARGKGDPREAFIAQIEQSRVRDRIRYNDPHYKELVSEIRAVEQELEVELAKIVRSKGWPRYLLLRDNRYQCYLDCDGRRSTKKFRPLKNRAVVVPKLSTPSTGEYYAATGFKYSSVSRLYWQRGHLTFPDNVFPQSGLNFADPLSMRLL